MDNPIKKARLAKGYTQEELARRSGLSLSTVYACDHAGAAAIGVDSLHKIAAALGVGMAQLATRQDLRAMAARASGRQAFDKILEEAGVGAGERASRQVLGGGLPAEVLAARFAAAGLTRGGK